MSLSERLPPSILPVIDQEGLAGFMLVFVGGMSFFLGFLLVSDRFGRETYFLFSFIWLLISSEILAPASSDVRWWNWLQVLKLVGWILFAYIVSTRIFAVV